MDASAFGQKLHFFILKDKRGSLILSGDKILYLKINVSSISKEL